MKEMFTTLEENGNRLATQVVIHPTPFAKFGDQFSEIEILIMCKLLNSERFN
jgi:hypothetical protein